MIKRLFIISVVIGILLCFARLTKITAYDNYYGNFDFSNLTTNYNSTNFNGYNFDGYNFGYNFKLKGISIPTYNGFSLANMGTPHFSLANMGTPQMNFLSGLTG